MLSKKKLLVTGASGFLGWHICQYAKKDWQVLGVTCSHPMSPVDYKTHPADLSQEEDVNKLVADLKPDTVIHTAAMSDANLCQEEPQKSRRINVNASAQLAKLCSEVSIPYLFCSSDLVFNGNKGSYDESSVPSPLSLYGEQKFEAEKAISKNCASALICRLPMMYGQDSPYSKNSLKQMITSLSDGQNLNLFTDEFRSPAEVSDVAKGLVEMIGIAQGILHFGGPERLSRFLFGQLVAHAFGFSESQLIAKKQKDIVMSAPRPADVSLNSSKAESLGFIARPVSQALKEIKLYCL